MEPALEAVTYYDPPNCTFPFGTHICVVEVDRDTGQVEIVKYVAVDDVGNVINPMIVDGQLHGGIAQGIAQALYEGAVYADNGELITATMNDYAIPKASMLPTYELDRTVTTTTVNPMGAKVRAKRERSARPRRSPTPSSTRSPTWECDTWTCRTRRSVSGAPCTCRTRRRKKAIGDGGIAVFPNQFDYHRPESVQAAASLLAADPDAKLLAGGHSLLPAMKLRLASPSSLVDLGGIDGLVGIDARGRSPSGR